MTELDLVARSLRQARAELSPLAADKARTRSALGLAPRASATAEGARTSPPSAWASLRASGKLGAALGGVVLVTGVIIGFWLRGETNARFRAGPSASGAPSGDRGRETAMLGGAAALTADVEGSRPHGEEQPEAKRRAESAGVAPEPPGAVKSTENRASRPRSVERRTQTHASSSGSAPRVFTATRFDEELALLQRVERAIRADDAALALALLTELDARFTATRLGEERQAARRIAECRLGLPHAAQQAQAFMKDHPSSVYSERVRAACALAASTEDLSLKNGAGADTHDR